MPPTARVSTPSANPSGVAGVGAGLGAGVAIGQAMGRSLKPPVAATAAEAEAEDVTGLLEKLHDLRTKGVLTEDEFNAKKAELLKKLV